MFVINFPSRSDVVACVTPSPLSKDNMKTLGWQQRQTGATEMQRPDKQDKTAHGWNSPSSCRPCRISILTFLSCLEEPPGGRVPTHHRIVGACPVSVSPDRGSQEWAVDCVITLHFWPPCVPAVSDSHRGCGGHVRPVLWVMVFRFQRLFKSLVTFFDGQLQCPAWTNGASSAKIKGRMHFPAALTIVTRLRTCLRVV